jgi:hypothetical protein
VREALKFHPVIELQDHVGAADKAARIVPRLLAQELAGDARRAVLTSAALWLVRP